MWTRRLQILCRRFSAQAAAVPPSLEASGKPSVRLLPFDLPRVNTKSVVNAIPEARMALVEATHLMKALTVGYTDLDVLIHLQCKQNDSAIRDLRGTSVLPVNFMRIKTLVFAKGDAAEQARAAGADIVGGDELIPKIQNNELEFDRVIATPEMLPMVAKISRILGPRGIMPTVKKGTVTEDVADALRRQACAVLFKADPNGALSVVIGKTFMKSEEIEQNVRSFLNDVKKTKQGKQTLSLQADKSIAIQLDRSEWKI